MEEKRTEAAIRAAVEAILFAAGDSVETSRLAQALELDTKEMEDILRRMELRYEEEDRGIRLAELEDSWQLCTKKEHYEELIRVVKQPKKYVLTEVLLETLSIVAYKQPVTKLEIEKIRGVKSDHAVNKLVEYGLIEEKGRLDAPGRPILFGTTEDFLRSFGVSSIEELPKASPEKMEDIREEVAEEVGEALGPEEGRENSVPEEAAVPEQAGETPEPEEWDEREPEDSEEQG